jgi:hypothetical protein
MPSAASTGVAGRALANSAGQSFALLMGAIDLAQIVVAFSTASQHQGALIILLHDAQNSQLAGIVDTGDALAPFVIGALSLLLGWIGNLIAAHTAGRNVARATGSAALGRRAGLIAIGLSMAAWIVLSVLAAAITGTNGLYATVDPYSSTPLLQQTASIMFSTLFGALLLCALAFVPYFVSVHLGTRSRG